MSNAIKRGLYRRARDIKRPPPIIRKDDRINRVMLEGGLYTDVVNPLYVQQLEQQILDLEKKASIQEERLSRMELALRNHTAAIRKLDKK